MPQSLRTLILFKYVSTVLRCFLCLKLDYIMQICPTMETELDALRKLWDCFVILWFLSYTTTLISLLSFMAKMFQSEKECRKWMFLHEDHLYLDLGLWTWSLESGSCTIRMRMSSGFLTRMLSLRTQKQTCLPSPERDWVQVQQKYCKTFLHSSNFLGH